MQEQEQEIQEKLAALYTARARAQVRFNQAQLRLKKVEARLQALRERLVVRETLSGRAEEDDSGPESVVPFAAPDPAVNSTPVDDESENDEETQKREAVRITRREESEMEEEKSVKQDTSIPDTPAQLPAESQDAACARESA